MDDTDDSIIVLQGFVRQYRSGFMEEMIRQYDMIYTIYPSSNKRWYVICRSQDIWRRIE